MRLRTEAEAAAWLDRVGLALLFPKPDIVLPSLWEAVAGESEVRWAIRGEEGRFVSFTPAMAAVWSWKDALPAQRRGCIGLHLVRTSALVAPRLVAALYALTGREGSPDDFRRADLDGLELEVAEAALGVGRPTTRRELRLLVGAGKREVDNAVNALQRKLVLTNAGRDDDGAGWSSTLHDVFARRWRARLRRIPTRDDALLALAETVLVGSGDASAADLAAALRLRRGEAAELLEALEARGVARAHDEDGITVWTPASLPARARPASGRGSSARSRAAGSRSSPRRSR
jgi:hypothetical protein